MFSGLDTGPALSTARAFDGDWTEDDPPALAGERPRSGEVRSRSGRHAAGELLNGRTVADCATHFKGPLLPGSFAAAIMPAGDQGLSVSESMRQWGAWWTGLDWITTLATEIYGHHDERRH